VATAQLAGDHRLIDPLTGRPERQTRPQRKFGELLKDLRRDADALPSSNPVQPSSKEFLRLLNRKQVVFERVEANGTVHPAFFKAE
jgi:hypothetical protein